MSDLAASFMIRPAHRADIAAITAIYRDAVLNGTATFEIDPPAEPEMAHRMEALGVGGYPYLVATTGGPVVGYAYAGPYRSRPAYRDTVEDSVYLAATVQGKGLGRRLLDALVGECETLGFRQMVAIIGDSQHVGSIRLHEAAGFRTVGTLSDVGYKHGRWLDTVVMQRALGPGGAKSPSR